MSVHLLSDKLPDCLAHDQRQGGFGSNAELPASTEQRICEGTFNKGLHPVLAQDSQIMGGIAAPNRPLIGVRWARYVAYDID